MNAKEKLRAEIFGALARAFQHFAKDETESAVIEVNRARDAFTQSDHADRGGGTTNNSFTTL